MKKIIIAGIGPGSPDDITQAVTEALQQKEKELAEQKAAEEARKIVMEAGTSEHQLGLAVDLMDKNYSRLVYEDMDQEMFAWLDAHCAEYGFIKRYPTRKLLLTGWDEPWHYRYVGVEAAKYIMEHGICYEEFYKHYMPDFKY